MEKSGYKAVTAELLKAALKNQEQQWENYTDEKMKEIQTDELSNEEIDQLIESIGGL